jgi:hypothetical protein
MSDVYDLFCSRTFLIVRLSSLVFLVGEFGVRLCSFGCISLEAVESLGALICVAFQGRSRKGIYAFNVRPANSLLMNAGNDCKGIELCFVWCT